MSEWIINLPSVEDAKELALEINPDSTAYKEMYQVNEGDEPWICVLAICDICKQKSIFFAPAIIYEYGISGVECSECGNISLYPIERSDE